MTQPDDAVLARARATDGFFPEDEAAVLMRHVRAAGDAPSVLEVGSYFGRSTLYVLAAGGPGTDLVCVDAFVTAAAYRGHSWRRLVDDVVRDDLPGRVQVLPMTLASARPHLAGSRFDVTFVDGDHSFLGAAQDIAIAVELTRPGGVVVCHDVVDLFPGVQAVTGALCRAGVLGELEAVGSIVAFEVLGRPSWLVDPDVYRDRDLDG